MKTLKINKIILLLVGLVVFNGCVQDDDFSTPNLSFDEPNIPASQIKLMTALAGDLAQEQSGFDTDPLDYSNEDVTVSYVFSDTDQYITGYVVSSDEAGNYFEELIIQDAPENPTIGIKLLIDVNPLFTKYEVGRKIYVKISGLSVGITNGVLTLGTLNGTEVDKIPSSFETQFIQRSNDVAEIVPLPLSIGNFTNSKTNMMVQLTDVQFSAEEVLTDGSDLITYASSASDLFDGERTLESCTSGASVIFSTSTFADFKGLALPTGLGTVNAVLSRNFEGESFIVAVNTPEDISFGSIDDRCIPFDISNFDIVYAEDFTDGLTGWDVINTVGTRAWEEGSFGGESYIRGSAFNGTGNTPVEMVSWLISPSFDFDAQAGELMLLEVADAFNNGEALKAYYSNDYVAGNSPDTATWIEIGTDQIEGLPDNTGFFNNEYDVTFPIDLSDITGSGFLAFVYDSNNETISSTIDLSDVKIVIPQ